MWNDSLSEGHEHPPLIALQGFYRAGVSALLAEAVAIQPTGDPKTISVQQARQIQAHKPGRLGGD